MTTEKSGKTEKILTKSLPQILDEIEDNIRVAAESAKRAEEASEEARRAAALILTGIKVEEGQVEGILRRIESLEKRLKSVENAIPEEKIVVLREISKEEAKKEILELFSQGQTLYYSDIAEQLGLDLKLVVEICNELQSKGEIEIIEDTLQRSR